MRRVVVFVCAVYCLSACVIPGEAGGQPYKGKDLPSDERMFRSVKKFLEKTGGLHFGEVRIVGKSLALDGVLQVFFCTGLGRQPFDVTRKSRALAPKWSDNRDTVWRDIHEPLDTSVDCFILEVFRLDNGTWIMRKDMRFLVIEE